MSCKPDGVTDCGPAINAAIAAMGPGGTVVVPDGNVYIGTTVNQSVPGSILQLGSGTYILDKTFWLTANYTRLRCKPQTILRASPSISYLDNDLIMIARNGVYPSPKLNIVGVAVEGCTLDGNQASTEVGRPYLTRSVPDDTHGNGINVNRCQSCRIMKNKVTNVVFQAIVHTGDAADDSNNGEISGNTVDGFGEVGIGIENHVNGWTVRDNHVRNGLDLVDNNHSGPTAGILVGCNGCTITTRMHDNRVIHNDLQNLTRDGLTGPTGILLGELADGTLVERNRVRTAGHCIRSQYVLMANAAAHVTVRDNTCTDTRATDTGAIDFSGPRMASVEGWVVSGNTINASQGGGITANNVRSSSISRNRISNVGLGRGAERSAIHIFAGSDGASAQNQICFNVATGATRNELTIDSPFVRDTQVAGNKVAGRTENGIIDKGVGTVRACQK